MIADQRSDAIDQVVLVGGFPSSDGDAWDQLRGAPSTGPDTAPQAPRRGPSDPPQRRIALRTP